MSGGAQAVYAFDVTPSSFSFNSNLTRTLTSCNFYSTSPNELILFALCSYWKILASHPSVLDVFFLSFDLFSEGEACLEEIQEECEAPLN